MKMVTGTTVEKLKPMAIEKSELDKQKRSIILTMFAA